MLRYSNRSSLFKFILPQSTYANKLNKIDNIIGNINNDNNSNEYNVNSMMSKNLIAFKYTNLNYSFSTFFKKNASKTQQKNKSQKKQPNNQQKYIKKDPNQKLNYQNQKQNYPNTKAKQQNIKAKQQNIKAKQQKSLNKNKSNNQKEQLKQQQTQPQQPKYQMSPDILEFNKQISSFIQTNLPQIKGSQQEQKSELKITTNFLSNLYKFINLKGDFLEVNAQRSLSPQNRRRISQLIKLKQRQQQYNGQVDRENSNDEHKVLIYHQELCNVLYLCSIVSDKKRFSNIISEFLSLLSLPLNTTINKKQLRFKFVMDESQLKSSVNKVSTITKQYLPIIVSKIFPPTLFITHDSLPLQIIKVVVQKRSSQQLLSSLRCLSKLLTIKQLKTLDTLVNEHFLAPTQYSMKKNINRQKDYSGSQGMNNYIRQQNKILSLEQLGRLTSILSQLNLNGNSIRTCQQIFSIIVHKQTINHKQTLQTLIQQLLLSQQSQNTNQNTNYISMSFVINLPQSQLKFDLLIKFYIGLAQIGAVDKQFGYLMEKLIIIKFKIKQLIGKNKQSIKDSSVWRQLNSRYCINSKQITILLTTLHKFKKGTQVMIMPTFNNNKQQNNQLKTNNKLQQLNKNNNIQQLNKKNNIQQLNKSNNIIQLNQTNLWLQLYSYYTQTHSIPDEFIFPLLSGMYRSFNTLVINYMSSYYQKRQSLQKVNQQIQTLSAIVTKLTLRLYQLDKQISYLQDLQLQKLIQLVIVVNLGANVSIIKTINKLVSTNTNKLVSLNSNKQQQKEQIKQYRNINIDLSLQFVNRILQQMTKRLQLQQKQKYKINQLQDQQDNTNQSINTQHFTNQHMSQQSMMNKLNPQLIKQQKTIQSILQFYLLFTKAHLQIFKITKDTFKNHKKTINNNNNKNKNNNNVDNNNNKNQSIQSFNKMNNRLQLILKDIKSSLKKNKINSQTSQLITILIKNTKTLTNYLKSYSKQQQKINNQHITYQLSLNLQTFADNLQSFIGFNPQQQILQYQNQLQSNLIKSTFPYLQEQQQVDSTMLQAITKRLIKTHNLNKQHFIVEKTLINYTLIQQQIIRINLINTQEDFKIYSNHLTFNNTQNQLHQ